MKFSDALTDALLQGNAPIVTEYELYLLGQTLFVAGEWAGQKISRGPTGWDSARAQRVENRLFARRAIVRDNDFGSSVWRIVQSTHAGSAEEVACIADPFCYVSHLSAMQRYGLTDRTPEALHLTTPTRPVWNQLWAEQYQSKLQNDLGETVPAFPRPGFMPKLRRRPVVVHETVHPAQPVAIRGERTRIASIGRTFVDMLSEPKLCGGMRHVIETWDRNARDWINDIIEAVNSLDAKIVKVRAGYLLTEHLGLTDPRIDAWAVFAQRGGSRKLDPEGAYAPVFSERWMISLNV